MRIRIFVEWEVRGISGDTLRVEFSACLEGLGISNDIPRVRFFGVLRVVFDRSLIGLSSPLSLSY